MPFARALSRLHGGEELEESLEDADELMGDHLSISTHSRDFVCGSREKGVADKTSMSSSFWTRASGALMLVALASLGCFLLHEAGPGQVPRQANTPVEVLDEVDISGSAGAGQHKQSNNAANSSRAANWAKEETFLDTFSKDPTFRWGVATSAYQVEGAFNEGGRSESIWDVFCHEGRAWKGGSGDKADDYYHRWRGDLGLVSQYGFDTYRFSIAWTRVMPFKNGEMKPNPEGVAFYRDILKDLASRSITPMVTIFHWDLPKELDWRDREVVDYFLEYAKFLFQTFPEINFWATFNEPFSFCFLGYGLGIHAPGVWSKYDAYKCGHNVLLAHAKVLDLYRTAFYKSGSDQRIGMVINFDFPFPLDAQNPNDTEAVQVEALKRIGWFADPLYFGDYPKVLKEILGDHLPKFTEEEKYLLLAGANHPMTYYGLNTYGGRYVSAQGGNNSLHPQEAFYKHDEPIGQRFIAWLFKVPQEMKLHLLWVNDRYQPREIYVTENGVSDPGDTMYAYTVHDDYRISFYRDYLEKVAEAKKMGVPVKGYVAWSLLDNFEWADGYKRRFGLTYVDFGTLERTPKDSAYWWTGLLKRFRSKLWSA